MADDTPTEGRHDHTTADSGETGGVPPGPSAPPPQIGNYRPLRKIGEGGFGEVWLAEQSQPVRRRVALKLIKPGMDSRRVVARFESERQALALMDHPFIAQILDAGTTPTGAPYFVMEYVRGIPITDYCDRNRLSTTQRLKLFIQVCEGVQHAHHKAVIHRDIKPTNVLVTEGENPIPKIIDFGVAKATAEPLTDHSLKTQLGHMIGTPAYMSPEQAELGSEDIDTRSDVYSLGVLLYEILVGTLPFTTTEAKQAGLDEIRRKIREDDPVLPSARLSTLGDATRTTAGNRLTDGPSLVRRIRGDLDWIVMKALEKERARRYGSPADLAADITRHLSDEPVLAARPSASYRVRKFARRHRGAVAAGSVTVAALVVGLLLATWGLARATRAETDARQEAAAAQQVASFMVDLFEAPDPTLAQGKTVTAREILDRGVERIQDELEDQPRTRATLLQTMGRVYRVMGLYDEAQPLLEQAVSIRDDGSGLDPLDFALALNELATVRLWQGAYDEAESSARRSVELLESLPADLQRELAHSLNTLGNTLQNKDLLDEAEAVHRRALAIRETLSGDSRVDLSQSLHNLAIVRFAQNDLTEAEALYKRAAEVEKAAGGTDNHKYATSLHTLAILYQSQSRFDEAIETELRSLEIREKVLGPDHPHVAFSLTTLGNLYRETGEPARAEPLLRRAVEIGDLAWSPLYPEVRWMRRSLAASLAEQQRPLEAESILQWLLEQSEAGADESSLPPTLNALARLYAASGRGAEAEAAVQRSLEIDERLSGAESPYLAEPLGILANLQRDRGELDAALLSYRRALDLLEGVVDPADPDRVGLLRDRADCLKRAGRDAEAGALVAEIASLAG